MLVASEQCILISFSSSVGNHLERCFTLNKCLHDSPACLFWSHIICHKWPLNQTSGKKKKKRKKNNVSPENRLIWGHLCCMCEHELVFSIGASSFLWSRLTFSIHVAEGCSGWTKATAGGILGCGMPLWLFPLPQVWFANLLSVE